MLDLEAEIFLFDMLDLEAAMFFFLNKWAVSFPSGVIFTAPMLRWSVASLNHGFPVGGVFCTDFALRVHPPQRENNFAR